MQLRLRSFPQVRGAATKLLSIYDCPEHRSVKICLKFGVNFHCLSINFLPSGLKEITIDQHLGNG
ncbi:MAG TPA: hypothetical protein VHD90_22195 [Phototrophicaceae bacterium]|nr:hypothetical protein [Phototrophicaceae bacterium]